MPQPNWMCYRLVWPRHGPSHPCLPSPQRLLLHRCIVDGCHSCWDRYRRPLMARNPLHRVCAAALRAQVLAVAPCVHSSCLLEHFQWHIDHERLTKPSHFQASDQGSVGSMLKHCSPLVVSHFGVHFAYSSSRLTRTSVDILPSVFNVRYQPSETSIHRRCKVSAHCHALGVK